MPPRFSIIVPTFKRPKLLAEALDSISAQTLSDWECIVVDDASGEDVRVPDDNRYQLLRRTSGGSQAGAINTGIAAASGEWVVFLDDDDIYEPHRLELVDQADRDADIVIVWGGILGGPDHVRGRVLVGNVHDTILEATTPQLGTVAVRRSSLLKFNESYKASADLEWWLRMSKNCTVATVPQLGHRFRVHGGVRIRNSKGNRVGSSFRLIAENAAYFRAHPKALAFRYRRAAAAAERAGDNRLARRLLLRSLRILPSARTLAQLLRIRGRTINRLEFKPPRL